MQSVTVISHSPSFNTYSSSDTLAQIAARVVQEFQPHSHDDFDHHYLFHHQTEEQQQQQQQLNNYNHESDQNDDDDDDEEFEFAILCREPDLSPIPADQIFYNSQIRPVYPLFNTDLLFADDVQVDHSVASATPPPKTSIPLGKLFIQERERDSASCSSSEADELDGVPVGTYCVWRPKAEEESAGRCKKSNSTGSSSSKRWKFRDLLYRSNSEGKDTFVFLAPSNRKRWGS